MEESNKLQTNYRSVSLFTNAGIGGVTGGIILPMIGITTNVIGIGIGTIGGIMYTLYNNF